MNKYLFVLSIAFITVLLFFQSVMADTMITDTIREDEHWTAAGSPYVAVDGIHIVSGATLTIDPGVVVKVGEENTIYVGGTLDADSVEFTKIDTEASWGCLRFYTEGENPSRLENCTIRHAASFSNATYAVHVYSGSPVFSGTTFTDCPAEIGIYVQNGTPEIKGCTFNGFSNYAVYLLASFNAPVTGNTFSNNGYGISVDYRGGHPNNPMLNGNTYLNSIHGDLKITGSIYGNVTWNEASGTVYRTPGFFIISGGSLTISPGIIVAIEPDERIVAQGRLDATGVTFTRADLVEGWGYMGFSGDGADQSYLENCVFEYASGYPGSYLTTLSMYSASPVLKACTIENCSTKSAIYIQNSSPKISQCAIRDFPSASIYVFGDSLPLIFNNTFSGNDTGVKVSSNGNGFFRGNTYSGNSTFGFNNLTRLTIDARYSFWGDFSGPYDPSDDTADDGLYNPTGTGDAVSDQVNYDPWLGSLPASTDGDNLPDDWELDHFSSTGAVDDNSDFDGDGLIDSYEFAYGANPDGKDSEGDGMPDGYESDHKFNPVVDDGRADADEDRFCNLREHLSVTDPHDAGDIPVIFADGDDDGDVDGLDLFGMAEELTTPGCSSCAYDLFPDLIVNDRDVFLFSEDYGRIDALSFI